MVRNVRQRCRSLSNVVHRNKLTERLRLSRAMSGGHFEFDDGGIFSGEWNNGQAHGYGICTGPHNEGKFEGLWKDGYEVCGVYTWPNGQKYEGEWRDGHRNGIGVEKSVEDGSYYGEWKDGARNGCGIAQFNNEGTNYQGTWIDGYQDGYGIEKYTNGGCYIGQWKKGKRCGFGVRVTANGAKYCKQFNVPSTINGVEKNKEKSNNPKEYDTINRCFNNEVITKDSKTHLGVEKTTRKMPSTDSDYCEPDHATISYSPQLLIPGRGFNQQRLSSGNNTRNNNQESINNQTNRESSLNFNGDSFDSTCSGLTNNIIHDSSLSKDAPCSDTGSHSSGVSTMSSSQSSNLSINTFTNEDPVGDIYRGEWLDDKRSGYGLTMYENGNTYIGQYNDNECHGFGALIMPNGSRKSGKWKNGQFTIGLWHPFDLRIFRFKSKVDGAVKRGLVAGKIAHEKSKLASSRSSASQKISDVAHETACKADELAYGARKRGKQFCLGHFSICNDIKDGKPLVTMPQTVDPKSNKRMDSKFIEASSVQSANISSTVHLHGHYSDHKQFNCCQRLSPISPRNQSNRTSPETTHVQRGNRMKCRTHGDSISFKKSKEHSTPLIEVAGQLLTGDEIELDYTYWRTPAEQGDTPVFHTMAPPPTFHNERSISEADAVFLATGLYRTIVGDIPSALVVRNPSQLQSSDQKKRPKSVTFDCGNETSPKLSVNSTKIVKADDGGSTSCLKNVKMVYDEKRSRSFSISSNGKLHRGFMTYDETVPEHTNGGQLPNVQHAGKQNIIKPLMHVQCNDTTPKEHFCNPRTKSLPNNNSIASGLYPVEQKEVSMKRSSFHRQQPVDGQEYPLAVPLAKVENDISLDNDDKLKERTRGNVNIAYQKSVDSSGNDQREEICTTCNCSKVNCSCEGKAIFV